MVTHPLHTLGFEPLTSSLADLGFEPQRIVRPQPVGMREPDSGRKIVQPTNNPAINQGLATDAMPAYKARLLEAIRHIPGARLAGSRDAKNPHRLAEKIEQQGQPAETVSDYGAAQIAVDSPQAKDAVVAAVKQHFTVLRQQDNFALGDPEYHYRSYSLQVQMPNGASEECRLFLRKSWRPTGRSTTTISKRATRSSQARTPSRQRRPRGHQRFSDGPVQLQKWSAGPGPHTEGPGSERSRVRLADGAVARVVYVDPNMRIARVRTDDGRNITVRHKDLRGSS